MDRSSATQRPPTARDRLAALVRFADRPGDSEDGRLRKAIGIVAGYATILAPLTLPLQAPTQPLAIPFAFGLAAYSIANLVVLARTRNFERYVIALISSGVVFVPVGTWFGGGITGSSPGLVWGFLIPAYAILALGPRRATPWFVTYLLVVGLMVVIDPLVRASVPSPPYGMQVVGLVMNTVVPVAIVFLMLRYTDERRRAAEARLDALLTNAIPRPIADRLRRGERRIAEAYPETTVLFADIVGFTPWAQRTPPDRVVAALDELFTSFDHLTARRGLEKIKTIGDAYMAVAGAPEPRADHAASALALARDIISAVGLARRSSALEFDVRVGIASGAVVGGVIGAQRLQFDLWGDTVNLASRLESMGVPGRIQVSAATRELLDDSIAVEQRELDIKGMGQVTAFLIAS